MKQIIFTFLTVAVLASCGTPKTYFTPAVRTRVESNDISITKLQYWVDHDVELRREVASGSTKVSAGVIKFENGKYVNIITLRKKTPGVCTKVYDDKIDVSFEVGDGRYLTFGKLKRDAKAPYTLYADNWGRETGEITYDGQKYYIMASGSDARLMIKKSAVTSLKVDKREMKGRKIE